jgi:hypothetical protein
LRFRGLRPQAHIEYEISLQIDLAKARPM